MEICTFKINVLALVFLANIFNGVTSSGEDGIPTNPCAAALCIVNTNCIAVPDIKDCKPEPFQDPPCPLRAMCIPNDVQLPAPYNEESNDAYCGTHGEKCDVGYKCGLVYPFCPIDVSPCLPVLGCIPISNKKI